MVPSGGSPVAVLLGASESARVRLTLSGRLHSGTSDRWDGNGLVTGIDGAVCTFGFVIAAQLRAAEVRALRIDVEHVIQGRAADGGMARNPDQRRRFRSVGRHWFHRRPPPQPAAFRGRDFDRSSLPPLLAQLAAVMTPFPVLGETAGPARRFIS